MKTWSVCNSIDGLFTGQFISGPSSALEANLPITMRAVEGRYDHICQRLDLETGAVIDHQPPQPNEDYEWRAENSASVDRVGQRWRWLKKPEVLEIEQRRAQAVARISDLERRQARIMRELTLDPATIGEDGKTPVERLRAIDQEIAALRSADRPR